MKAESIEDGKYQYPCFVSEKLDGWRCLISGGVMYTSGGKPFKPAVQARFKTIIDAAQKENLILDGELYFVTKDFGLLSSTLSASVEVMAERNLRFYCFDAIHLADGIPQYQESFVTRLSRLTEFSKHDRDQKLFVLVEQHLCKCREDAVVIYDEVVARDGEGVMLRLGTSKYEPNARAKTIVKWKHFATASGRVLAVHQQACPLQYAEEVKIVDGVQQGFKLTCGSVTVETLPDQPLPAGNQQNCKFTGTESLTLRKKFWNERETIIGKVVDFVYLKGATNARMGHIVRLRDDIA